MTAIDTSVAVDADPVIDNVVVADMLPDAALIVVVPAATPVAWPEFEIFALPVSEDVHVTDAVMSCVELSE